MKTSPSKEQTDAKMFRVRLEVLQELIEKRYGGNIAEFARDIDRQYSYVYAIATGDRSIGERISQYIETRLKLVPGSLVSPESVRKRDGVTTFGAAGSTFQFHVAPVIPLNLDIEAYDFYKEGSNVDAFFDAIRKVTKKDLEMRRCPMESSGRVVAVKVDNDINEPCAFAGDEVYIDLAVNDPVDNSLVLVHAEGWRSAQLLVCKKVGGSFFVRPCAPAYADAIGTVPLRPGVRLLGRALGNWRTYASAYINAECARPRKKKEEKLFS